MKNLQVRVKTDLADEPISIDEAKLYCKVTGTSEDDLIYDLIRSARQLVEQYLGISCSEKVLHATWVTMPEDYLCELPFGPVISVTAGYWIDEEGTEAAMTLNDDYWVYGDQDAIVKISQYWTSGLKETSSVRIEYKAGYGDTATETLPEGIRMAIRKLVVRSYESRGDTPGAMLLDNEIKREIAPYRKKLWF
jgi:uncharacterized phiE125 gp8 family phage protein